MSPIARPVASLKIPRSPRSDAVVDRISARTDTHPSDASITTSSRISKVQLAKINASLTDRDRAVVESLSLIKVASARQLQRLHFTASTSRANSRATNRLLERLTHLQVLSRLDRRVGGIHAGSAGYVYSLGLAGLRLFDRDRGHSVARRRPVTPSPAFLDHVRLVTELYVQLREAEHAGRLKLDCFQAEPLAWRSFTGTGGGRMLLRPDAYLRVLIGAYEDSYFVEVDRGTEWGPAITRKLVAYERYFASGREQAAREVFPQILFLVLDRARNARLIDLVAKRPPERWPLYRVALFSEATDLFAGDLA